MGAVGRVGAQDSERNRGVLYPGLAQRMSAGTGIWHSEMNNSGTADVHFVQMWVPPDTESIDPGYEQLDINAELDKGGLVPIASGKGHDAAISIRQRGAVLWGGRLGAGEAVAVPDDRHVHVFDPRRSRGAVERRCRTSHRRRITDADRRTRRCRGAHLGNGVTS
jgi:redox-sensitive bicupin YhaK (pirin superfamily)